MAQAGSARAMKTRKEKTSFNQNFTETSLLLVHASEAFKTIAQTSHDFVIDMQIYIKLY